MIGGRASGGGVAKSPLPAAGRVAAVVALFAGAACASSGGAVPEVAIDPIVVTRPAGPLEPVSFLTGCWAGTYDGGESVMEERWSPAADGLMLATTRFLRGGEVVGWEFAHLEAAHDGIVLTPYPSGERSEHAFRRTGGDRTSVVFEAPEHDYPKRIRYRLDDLGMLHVAIDGGVHDPEPRSWTLGFTPC